MIDEERDDESDLDLNDEDDNLNDSYEEAIPQGDVMEWCPKCQDIKPHVRIGEDSEKFRCIVCNHEHIREELPEPVKKSLLSDEERENPEAQKLAWKRLVDVDNDDIKPYSIRIKPVVGDVLKHSKFGVGCVIELTDASKAEILFEEGIKRLICGK